jgi:hypothetical protein
MAEPGVRRGKLVRCVFYPFWLSCLVGRTEIVAALEANFFAESHLRLDHAASIVTRAKRQRQIIPAVCRVLEPRPTNAVEDEYERDRRRTPNAEPQTLPQPFNLLQHSFGDLADLAGSQEREMQQLEQ